MMRLALFTVKLFFRALILVPVLLVAWGASIGSATLLIIGLVALPVVMMINKHFDDVDATPGKGRT